MSEALKVMMQNGKQWTACINCISGGSYALTLEGDNVAAAVAPLVFEGNMLVLYDVVCDGDDD